ncbi:MAG: hypothetical protein ACLUR5_16765 [Eubacterium ventriosum]
MTKGNILEPSMGIGNFFGSMPIPMQRCRLYGVEMDDVTGRIAKQAYIREQILQYRGLKIQSTLITFLMQLSEMFLSEIIKYMIQNTTS